MVYRTDICPRCHQRIAEDRVRVRPSVCDVCGFVMSGMESHEGQRLERSFLVSLITVSVLLVLGFIQMVNWGSYSFEVIPLQAARWTHTARPAQLERLVQISFEIHKYGVTEAAYADLANLDHTAYLRLGKFEMTRGKYLEACDAFRQYFAYKKDDLEAHYLFARALGETGHIDEASKHFEYVLHAKPGVRQVTVLQNYVRALTRAGRLDRAKRVIENARTQDKTASMFMDTEYKVILERLHSSQHT